MLPKRKGRSATQQPPAKRTLSMSSNIQPTRERTSDGHSGSVHGCGHACSRVPAHNHSTGNSVDFTSSSSGAPVSTMPTTQPGDSSRQTSAMVPQEVIRQLSDVLTHLTNAIQVSDPPQATGSTHLTSIIPPQKVMIPYLRQMPCQRSQMNNNRIPPHHLVLCPLQWSTIPMQYAIFHCPPLCLLCHYYQYHHGSKKR